MVFRWRSDDGPLLVLVGSTGPLLTKFSESAHDNNDCGMTERLFIAMFDKVLYGKEKKEKKDLIPKSYNN